MESEDILREVLSRERWFIYSRGIYAQLSIFGKSIISGHYNLFVKDTKNMKSGCRICRVNELEL